MSSERVTCVELIGCGLIEGVPGVDPERPPGERGAEAGTEETAAAAAAAAASLQSCPILCDPRDSSPPGPPTPFPGILQARTLEWVSISFSNA